MREILDIVKGAVSAKDLVPVLTHVAIHDGRICGYDGRVYIDAPAPAFKGLSFTVPALRFIAALESCGDEVPHVSTTEGRCLIVARNTKITLPIGPIETFPRVEADESKRLRLRPGLIGALRLLQPFVGDDASRPWASGVLIEKGRMLATNNISIADLTFPGPTTRSYILPSFAIDELTRIGIDPSYMTLVDNAVTFYIEGDIWIRSKLIAEPWPESAPGIIDQFHEGARLTPVPMQLREAIERVRPFCEDAKAPIVVASGQERRRQGARCRRR